MLPHPDLTAHRQPLAPIHHDAAPERVGTQLLRCVVHQSGPQRTTVTITERHSEPVLHVRAGGLFVYAATAEVVIAHLTAWRDTTGAARLTLPAATRGAPPSVVDDGAELSVIVRQDTAPAVVVSRYPADRTRPGRPAFVETVTGPVATRSYDRQCVADVLGVWLQAAALGAIVWGSPELADL